MKRIYYFLSILAFVLACKVMPIKMTQIVTYESNKQNFDFQNGNQNIEFEILLGKNIATTHIYSNALVIVLGIIICWY